MYPVRSLSKKCQSILISSTLETVDRGDEIIHEIEVLANKTDHSLMVKCTLVSEGLFSLDKSMQLDILCKYPVALG